MKTTATIQENITVAEYNRERIAFAQTIDFEPLFDHIRGFAKVDCEFSTPVISLDRMGDVYIGYESEELSNQAGPFAAILRKCHIASFNSWIFKDRETGAFGYHGTASIRYEHKDGGSNGMEVTQAVYSDGNGWIFRDAGA